MKRLQLIITDHSGQNGCQPHVAPVHGVEIAVNEFIRSADVIVNPLQHIDAVGVGGYV